MMATIWPPGGPQLRPALLAVTPWIIASLTLVVVQILAGFVWPHAVLVTAIGIGGQALIIGHHAIVIGRRQRRQRALWWLLATAMLLWAAGFAAIVVLKDVLVADDSQALFDSLLFIARGAPIMLMLTSGIDDEAYGRVWWLDIAQAGVFIAAAGLLLFGNPWSGDGTAADDVAHRLRELQFVALSLLAIGVAALHRNRATVQLFRPLAAMLLSYVVVAGAINRIIINTLEAPSGSPAFALGAVPMLTFLMMRASPQFLPPAPVLRLAAGARLLAPAVLPVATLLLVLAPGRRGDVLGAALGLTVVGLYGWRMVEIQLRHRRSIAELTVAHSEARGLSLTDPLTGLGNRRHFDAALAGMVASPGSVPVAVLMIDADWFKAFNDTHGHAAGDAALRQIGSVLANHCPPGGAAVRLGGEEFAILARLAAAPAAALAETLRAAVAALAISHPRAPNGVLSISVGVAVTDTGDADVVIAAADAALYAAKDGGRNRVCPAANG